GKMAADSTNVVFFIVLVAGLSCPEAPEPSGPDCDAGADFTMGARREPPCRWLGRLRCRRHDRRAQCGMRFGLASVRPGRMEEFPGRREIQARHGGDPRPSAGDSPFGSVWV